MIEMLEKVRSNISSLEPLERPAVEESPHVGRGKPAATRTRRERAVSPS
jgi:hypothetical protein